ncbi:DNA-binding transcriptional regulator OxyR [Lysobacteraceae bacterium NML75-0749]|nr:DNA-binding transcriptional regulator OxyR [Xanthomonadaceae bacterium NML03-0222]PJJ98300.1 DNA-binding transcriptional regulator OxyR [Xanthomonadaceae bacterium NML75-0749]PJK04366.1 DNA-binding transcriptional regulator OxyR [Xanthomonadaceae bacterium NML71-0210]PJK05439.1 DNA-binding transcriptional regulator OxyR [Xanthomonadaceae bacterium NML91-0268]
MNLRDLKYLIALADHRHFGRAAEASFVSQPTLSTQIKKLEDELGVQLFERAPRKVMLTPVGEEIIQRARGIVAEVESMRELARRSQDPESGSLRLGAFPTLAPYFLPHAVPALQAALPRLELLLVEEKSDVLLAQLREGRIDAALLALPVHDEQLHMEPLFDEPFWLATYHHGPLSSKTEVRMDELAQYDLLLLEDGHCLREQALDVCRLSGAKERPGFRATSLETLRQMVAAGAGITLLPALAVRPPVSQPEQLKLLPFKGEAPTRSIALIWRRSSALTPLLNQVANTLRNCSAQLLGA